MASYTDIRQHLGMVYDEVRNQAYERALSERVNEESIVLDLGAGLGIHGLIAARLGAKRVYMVDSSPVMAQAKEVAAANGLADRCVWIPRKIEEAELPERVDLIVSVLTGNFLLMEDLLPILFHARERFLKPSGRLVPDGATMFVAPVTAGAFHARHIGQWSHSASELSYAMVRPAAANQIYCDQAKNIDPVLLSAPAAIVEMDFNSANKAECDVEVEIDVAASGECHGFLGWFDLQLAGEVLSTGPNAPATHWSQAFLPLDPPLSVEQGDALRFRLRHPQHGDWTWEVRHRDENRRHSTFYSRRLDQVVMKRRSPGHKPGLSRQGELAHFVTGAMAEGATVEHILEATTARFGRRFAPFEDLEERVLSIISGFGE